MAVNGVEIKVGQKWRTRGGNFVVVYGSSGCLNRPWRIYSTGGMYWVTDEGFTQTSMNPTHYDLIALNNKPKETQQERFAATDETAGHIDSGLKMLSEYEKAERDSAFVESLAVKWASGGANAAQVGGDHYKTQTIQPWDYILANGLGFLAGNVVKYVSRFHKKNGVEDLKKARHYLDKLIESEQAK